MFRKFITKLVSKLYFDYVVADDVLIITRDNQFISRGKKLGEHEVNSLVMQARTLEKSNLFDFMTNVSIYSAQERVIRDGSNKEDLILARAIALKARQDREFLKRIIKAADERVLPKS